MELIIKRMEHLGWKFEEVNEVSATIYRFVKEDGALSLYLGIKSGNIFVEVAGKRVGSRINVSPERNATEFYAYIMRRYPYSADVENAAKQVLEELTLVYNETLSVVKAVLDVQKEV